jgi:Tfp pilus assembly protein PilO
VNDFLSQLNLTPQERRIVVVVFLVVIVVLNLLFVWPHFGEWGRTKRSLQDMYNDMETYNRMILKDVNTNDGYQMQINKLAQAEGPSIMEKPVDPQVQLNNTITMHARRTGVNVEGYNPGSVKTNEFFEEHTMVIPITSQESNLVNFLFGMGNDGAMIRVSKLDLKPADQNRYHLHGNITLTANYAKPGAPKAAASPAPKPGIASPQPPPRPNQPRPNLPPAPSRAAAAPPRPGVNPAQRPPAPPARRIPTPGTPNPQPNQGQNRPG